MEILDIFLLYLDTFLVYVKELVALCGAMVIVVGSLRALYHLLFNEKLNTNYIRWELGNSVILGLDFIVGADIIGSLIRPDYYNIGLLSIVVVLRTFLSYFLTLELTDLTPRQQQEVAAK